MTERNVETGPRDSGAGSTRLGLASRRAVYLALVVLLLAIGLRLLGLDKGIWLDEHATIAAVTHDSLRAGLDTYDPNNPPLYFILLRIWSQVSTSEPYLRLFSVLLGSSTVVVMMAWLRHYGAAAGLLGGLLTATLPLLLRYSQELRGYPLLLLLTALAFYVAFRLARVRETAGGYALLALLLSAAAATHMVGAAIVPFVLLYLLLNHEAWRRVYWPGLIAAAVAPALVFGYLNFFFLARDGTGIWWFPALTPELALSTARTVLLGGDALFLPLSWLEGMPTLALLYDRLLKVLLVLLALLLTIFGNWRRSWTLLVAALGFWSAVVAFSLLVMPIFWDRTVLAGIIPFIGFLAVQAGAMQRRWRRGASVGFAVLALIFSVGWIGASAWQPVEPFKPLADLLAERHQPGDLVIFYPRYVAGPMGYYVNLTPEETLGVRTETAPAQVDEQVAAWQEDHEAGSRLFLVVREDMTVVQDRVTYEGLRTLLRDRLGPPTFQKTLDFMVLRQYR